MVKTSGDYSIHMCDPDRLVDWDHIEEIHVDTHSTIACPICLYEPTAGKMTKCGHVYCWSCILHYLSLSDKTWRKCPICFESIYKSDLKSVRVIKRAREYQVGDELELTLMFKPRVSKYATICLPVSALEQFNQDERAGLSYGQFEETEKYTDESTVFLKIHAHTPQQILDKVLKREREELERQLDAEKDQPEVCFVNEALALLDERDFKIREQISQAGVKKSGIVKVNNSEKVEKPSIRYVDAFEEDVFEETKKENIKEEIKRNFFK